MIPGTKKSIVSLIDVSREHAARQELADSEEKFRGLSESLSEEIYMIRNNRFIYVNPAFTRLFGYTAEQILAFSDFSELFIPEDRPHIRRAVTERLALIRDSERPSVHGIQKNGTIIRVGIHGSRTRYKGGAAIIGTITRIDNQETATHNHQPDPRTKRSKTKRYSYIRLI